jgi:N-carbamoyl-L-amino-acid hydrolase
MSGSRREFLGRAAAAGALALFARRGFGQSPQPRVELRRIREHLQGLSAFGRPPGGTFADGVSRVGYSDADVAGRGYVMELMRAAGLSPTIDPAGNILARRKGSEDALPPLLFGSHIDSVPNGGNFDGDVGSIGAIEVMQTLHERRIATRRPLELVIWANEEGVAFENGLCGSRAAAGKLEPGELLHVWNGVTKRDAIKKLGGDPDRIAEARRAQGSFHAYLELHIEQGGSLDKAGIPIGVVEGIVAIDRYEAVVRGFANHAGTTPMPERKDALVAASQLVLAVREVVRAEPGRQVGTVGHLRVAPNAPNVIPGEVRMTIELRDLQSAKIARLAETIRGRAREIAARSETEITIQPLSHHDEALATPEIQRAIEAAADKLSLRHTRLPSGAGHDAQMMALLGPMGMIFVPSVAGISHSPRELTRFEDCANGADVLLHSVLALAG